MGFLVGVTKIFPNVMGYEYGSFGSFIIHAWGMIVGAGKLGQERWGVFKTDRFLGLKRWGRCQPLA